MSRHCFVVDCSNGDYRIERWKQTVCDVHEALCGSPACTCKPPFAHTEAFGRTRFRVEDQHSVATQTEFTAIPHIVAPTNAPAPRSVIHELDLSNIQEVPDHVRNISQYSVDELAKTLYVYQQTGYLCDTVLVAEDGQLKAHSAVLAAASPLFKSSLVALNGSPIIQPHIVLPGIKLHFLKIALHFMYTGDIVIPPEYWHPGTIQSIIVTLLHLGLPIVSTSDSTIDSLATCSQKSDKADIQTAVIPSNNDTSVQPTSDIVSAAGWQVPVQLAPVTITQQQWDKFTERAAPVKQSLCSGSVDISLLKQVNERPYRGIRLCDFCGKLISGYSKFMAHLSIHTGQKNFVCKLCEKRFSLKGILDQHMLRHTEERPHVCEVCSKSYRCSSGLQEHRLSRHALGPKVRGCRKRTAKVYECSVCKRQFLSSVRLRQHMRSHTGEKPFECTKCPCKFAMKQALTWHMRRHTGEIPYLCEECGCSFSQPSSYYGHLIKHHGYQKKHRTPPAARIISTDSTATK